jgi:lipoate-protein ligase A
MARKIQEFKDRFKYSITVTISVLTLIGLFFGAYQFIDTTYAESHDLTHLTYKVDIKILDDRINSLQDRIWSLEDRKQTMDDDETIRIIEEQLRKTRVEKERLEKELDAVITNYRSMEGVK